MFFSIFAFYFFHYVHSTSKECSSLLNNNYKNYGRHWDFLTQNFLEEYRQNHYDPLFEETGQHCFDFDRNLTELERSAPIILTGTVEKLVKSKNGRNFGRLQNEVFTGLVRVRRVLKGKLLMVRDVYNQDLIGVDGFFDWNICDSRIEEKDTKIFFLTKLESGSKNTFADVLRNNFRLNSSLLRISVKNLKLIGQIIKNRKMIKLCEIERRPCEAMLCSYGAKCFVKATSRHPYCACDYSCENYIELPICGSDNVTYPNECHLKSRQCKSQRKISIESKGSCAEKYKDPCVAQNCLYGSNCVLSPDGKSGRCVCPERCYNYGDSKGSRPVCGQDGRDYASLCHIRKESCKQNENLAVKYVGLCDPCSNVECPESTICKLNDQRSPVCRCSEQCHLDYVPVCGSDGNSYRNLCLMRVQACKSRVDIRVFANGLCEDGENPCRHLKCDYGEQCHIDNKNQSSCQCMFNCERIMRPVCGKNGGTYDNECHLKLSACQRKERNKVEYQGACGGQGPCSNYECSEGSYCMVKNDKPTCQCPICSEEFDPVCASNGVTFGNECKLRREVCRTKKKLFVKYRGLCEGCQTKICDFYGTCVSDFKGVGTCQCLREECGEDDGSVCGTDGVSYDSECDLRSASCNGHVFIALHSKGRCNSCARIQCAWGARCQNGSCVCPTACPPVSAVEEPVCGSDGVLYKSLCFMLKSACAKGMKLKSVEKSRCPAELMSSLSIYQPASCECNRLGALSTKCDPFGQCTCKPGVGGKKCDFCLQGFWGLHLIKDDSPGCMPCGCSAFGLSRDDCAQTTGRCVCKRGVVGQRCDRCSSKDEILTPGGCRSPEQFAGYYSRGCDGGDDDANAADFRCLFGARCQELSPSGDGASRRLVRCVCPNDCSYLNDTAFKDELAHMEVCGSDGRTYETACHLNKVACECQRDIVVRSFGRCSDPISRRYSTRRVQKVARHIRELNFTSERLDIKLKNPKSWVKLRSKGAISINKFNDRVDFNYRMVFLPESTNGSMLLYEFGQIRVHVSMTSNFVWFSFSSKRGRINFKTANSVSLFNQNILKFSVQHKMCILILNDRTIRRFLKNNDQYKIGKKNKNASLVLGNIAEFRKRKKFADRSASFIGCINHLSIDNHNYRSSDVHKSNSIGVCQDQLRTAISVDSDVDYLKLPSFSKNTEPVIFSFGINTKVDRAIIFYERSSGAIPFILALEDSKIAFIFTDTNGTTHILKSDISISDGKWHTVLMERLAGLCTIIIDNDKSKIYTSNFKGVLSVTDHYIYFGKTSTVAFKKYVVLQDSSFVGCLRDIRFKGSLVNLNSVSSNLTACRQ